MKNQESENVSEGATSKRPYKSLFSEKFVSFSQYIAEIALLRKAKSEKQNLVPRFWQLEKYKKDYRVQTILATKLKKEFPEALILKVLTSTEFEWCWSLGSPKLKIGIKRALAKEKALAQHISTSLQIVTPPDEIKEGVVQFTNKTQLDKLRELDNGE